MRTGDMLAELRAWRDEFAKSHSYDVHAMAEALRALDSAGERKAIRGEPRRPVAVRTPNRLLTHPPLEKRSDSGDVGSDDALR
jgi:Zn-dependent protease with chaperone function